MTLHLTSWFKVMLLLPPRRHKTAHLERGRGSRVPRPAPPAGPAQALLPQCQVQGADVALAPANSTVFKGFNRPPLSLDLKTGSLSSLKQEAEGAS